MIEFNQDGPFAEKADQLFPDRVRIIGLGQAGAAVCDQLVLHGRGGQDLWVFDSDQLTVEGSVVPNRFLLGREIVRGLGCSGDLDLAREIVTLEDERLSHVARGCDFLVLVVGLGGATGVALAERLIELGHELGAKVVVIGVQPFAFEGWGRREKAIRAITHLRQQADSVLILANDRVKDHPATQKSIRHGYHLMNEVLAKTAQTLAQVVCKRGLIQLSFADVRSLFGRYAGAEVLENCWAGHVEGTVRDCTEELVEDLLAGPLLAEETIWNQIDHAIVAVSGSRNLSLSDVQEMVVALKDRLPVNIPIATSASLDEESHEKVRMSVLFATTAPVPGMAELPAPQPAAPKPRLTQTAPLSVPKAEIEPPVVAKPQPKPRATKAPAKPPVQAPVVHPIVAEELAAEADTVPLPAVAASVSGSTRPRKHVAKQEEMSFEPVSRGRFEKTHETMYRGENLDQPTFRRRGLKIKA